MRKILSHIYKQAGYRVIKMRNRINCLMLGTRTNKYLFILAPPYSGSTLLNEIISTSPFVSVNNPFESREGQQLPELKKIMFRDGRWSLNLELNWLEIKMIWRKYWDVTKPVLLDKSPPNIVRAMEIQNHFNPAFFIIFLRDPYVLCEGLIRKDNLSPERAATFVVKIFEHQRKNIDGLEKTFLIKYQDLVNHPDKISQELIKFIPELIEIKVDLKYKAHNASRKPMKIVNLDPHQMERLNPTQIAQINSIFLPSRSVFEYFSYVLIINDRLNRNAL
jgi:hypothetical protein